MIEQKEDGTWGVKKEPFATIEVETEEDFNYIQEAIKLYSQVKRGDMIVIEPKQ